MNTFVIIGRYYYLMLLGYSNLLWTVIGYSLVVVEGRLLRSRLHLFVVIMFGRKIRIMEFMGDRCVIFDLSWEAS